MLPATLLMKKLLIAAVAVLPLLLTSCVTDRFGAGRGETERFYADGHIRNPYYGRKYHYDPHSPHDAHARQRDGKDLWVGDYDSRYRAYENPYYPTAYLRRYYYYDPNSIHDAYARPRGPYRKQLGANPGYLY
jgi:hypothetical protein